MEESESNDASSFEANVANIDGEIAARFTKKWNQERPFGSSFCFFRNFLKLSLS